MAAQPSLSSSTQRERSGMAAYGPYLSGVERFFALAALGQARCLEWQAAAVHVAAVEWAQHQQEWLDLGRGLESMSQSLPWLRPQTLETALDVVQTWCAWSVKAQLATAHGLLASLSADTLGLPGASGRRAGFDLGRRSGAVVIDFPDRRAHRR